MARAPGLAFAKTKERIWFLIGVMGVAFLVQIVPNIVAELLAIPEGSGMQVLLDILGVVLSVYMSAGLIRVMLKVVRDEEARIEDLFADPKLIPRYFVTSLLCGLIILGGFLLLIVPGVIWSIKYGMFGYFLVEHQAGIRESLKRSAALTQGAKGQLFVMGLATAGIILLGLLALGVGVFFALPMVSVAHAYAYTLLHKYAEANGGAAVVTEVAATEVPATPTEETPSLDPGKER